MEWCKGMLKACNGHPSQDQKNQDNPQQSSSSTTTPSAPPLPNIEEQVEAEAERRALEAASTHVESSEETLISIPGAVVHLIDGEESTHLATGTFSLLRLLQDDKAIAVLAKVGKDLSWPLVQDQPTAKLDKFHYFFSLKYISSEVVSAPLPTPNSIQGKGKGKEVDEEVGKEEVREEDDEEDGTLNYGVTFAGVDTDETLLEELDKLLNSYSYFAAPAVVQGPPERKEEIAEQAAKMEIESSNGKIEAKKGGGFLKETWDGFFKKASAPAIPSAIPESAVIPSKLPISQPDSTPAEEAEDEKKKLIVEESSAEYWTTLAPNVEDYSSTLAKSVAAGSGQIIRGIFWCSDSTIAQLEKGGDFMRKRIKPRKKAAKISPHTIKNLKRVKKLSKMTEKVARGILSGILISSGTITGALIKSKGGQAFFKLMPGEVALVSLDAFGKIFDAVEKAGRDVLTSTKVTTAKVVSHRYGDDAAEVADVTLSTAGHVFATAWTISKIRKALTPGKEGGSGPRPSTFKTVGKAAMKAATGAKK